MLTRDIPKEMYLALATGLAGDTDWPVHSNNFIRYDKLEGDQDPEKLTTADGDFPQAVLEGPISGETNLHTGDVSFATYSDSPPPHWLETGKYVFRLTLKTEIRLTEYSSLTMEAINAVRRLGPRIGLPFVTDVTAKFTSKEEINQENGIKQIETTILISVGVDNDGEEFTGE